MTTLFNDDTYADVIAGLRDIGYQGALLEEGYAFRDYFTSQMQERQIAAATFGQTPPSYESACIGVALSNGLREQGLVNTLRSLGAPIVLEVDNSEVREWAVSRNENNHGLVGRYPSDRIRQLMESRAPDWKPQQFLRDKNIGTFHWAPQLTLFAGLVPELEEQIQETLEPLLHDALSATQAVYRETTQRDPEPARLFKLIFWILTAKVFHDRKVNGFKALSSDPDEILNAVALRYKEAAPKLLNRPAREVAASRIWHQLDFRNLSVEVLAQMWSAMLIDDTTKERLRIHRTSRSIVRYIVEKIPFQHTGDDRLTVLEPCSGSAVFLIGAMNALRLRLFGAPPAERHKYFTQRLVGIEKDPFGVEISKLALTLADFPNPGGWNVIEGDVFEAEVLPQHLQRAGVVLCNPPFGKFAPDEREHYQPSSSEKPAELLNKVLESLHPGGVLGFVLPRIIVDGRSYSNVRRRLVDRFAQIELTVLPDKAFDADSEIGLLIATEPIPHDACRLISRKVKDDHKAWREFELGHQVTSDHVVVLGAEKAASSFAVPDLPEVWDYLSSYEVLNQVAELHRGIEWNKPLTKNGKETGNRAKLIHEEPSAGFIPGVAPQSAFNVFQTPRTWFLNTQPANQRRNAYKHPWHKPKAILQKFARSRGPWRITSFPDTVGLSCHETYIGVWPNAEGWNEWLLSAVLNSPVANAFVATREGKFDVSIETLKLIPVPHFTESKSEQIRASIREYQKVSRHPPGVDNKELERLLFEIDAHVLDAYRMPPKLEYQLLRFFQGQNQARPTSHDFGDYLPANCEVYFSLSQYLSPTFHAATAGEMRRRMALG
ncbi:MAG TPA: N-6 DNA methylase [Pyrinomonadaceae bacterium]|jgi:hypothetical protein